MLLSTASNGPGLGKGGREGGGRGREGGGREVGRGRQVGREGGGRGEGGRKQIHDHIVQLLLIDQHT